MTGPYEPSEADDEPVSVIEETEQDAPILDVDDERIQPYNFYHQETIERVRLRPLEPVLETVAHRMSSVLASSIRTPVTIEIGDSDQISWEEFVSQVPDPTFVTSALTYPIEGRMLLHVPVPLALQIIDCFFGGDGFGQPQRDQLTDIERVFILPILNDLWAAFEAAMAVLVDLRLGLIQVAPSASSLPIGRAADMCWVIDLPIQIGDSAPTRMQLLIAVTWLLPTIEQIEAEQASGVIDERPDNHETEQRLMAVPVEMRICHPPITLTTNEILALRPGDVIAIREGTAEENTVLDLVTGEIHLGKGILFETGNKLACTVVSKTEEFV